MTFCPDCEQEIPDAKFLAHRESEHPPELRTVTITESLHAGERMGWEGLADPL